MNEPRAPEPTLMKLSTGYWLARWDRENWAQWPVDRSVRREDFFHPEFSYSDRRVAEIEEAVKRLADV